MALGDAKIGGGIQEMWHQISGPAKMQK